ncbi:hypothetical protein MHYP_G00221770 [Metynnis hypsauchen]
MTSFRFKRDPEFPQKYSTQPKSEEFLQLPSLNAPHRPGVQLLRRDVTLCWPHFLVLAKHSRSRSETAGQLQLGSQSAKFVRRGQETRSGLKCASGSRETELQSGRPQRPGAVALD